MMDIEQFKFIPPENQSYDFRRRNIQYYTSHMGSFLWCIFNLDILLNISFYVPQKT